MQNKARQVKLIIIVGFSGSGKTTLVQKFIDNHLSVNSEHSRALIITPHDREFLNLPYTGLQYPHHLTFSGAYRHIYNEGHTLGMIRKHYKKGLLIFDDCRAYFKASLNDELHKLFIGKRQHEIDIIASGHGLTEIPPKFFTFASDIIIFRTRDNLQKRKNDLIEFSLLQMAQNFVNEKAKSNPHFHIRINLIT